MASSTSSSSGGPDAASEADERQPFKKKRSGWDVQSARDGTNSLSASFTHVLSSFMQQKQTPSSSLNGSLLNAAVPSKADHRIYIGSINYEVTETQMRKLFEPFGQIVKVDMSVDPSNGKTKGFCFIEYQNLASVQAAMVMDGLLILMCSLVMETKSPRMVTVLPMKILQRSPTSFAITPICSKF